MKKGIIIWVILIVFITIVIYLLSSPPEVSCSSLRLRDAKLIMGTYRKFIYSFTVLLALFWAWLSFRLAERKSLTKGKRAIANFLLWFIPIGYAISYVFSIGFYLIGKKADWLSLSAAQCPQWSKWTKVLVKVKSLFGHFVSDLYLAVLLDLLLIFAVAFIISFFLVKRLRS